MMQKSLIAAVTPFGESWKLCLGKGQERYFPKSSCKFLYSLCFSIPKPVIKSVC